MKGKRKGVSVALLVKVSETDLTFPEASKGVLFYLLKMCSYERLLYVSGGILAGEPYAYLLHSRQ